MYWKCVKSAHFGSTYTKTGMIQRRATWPLLKDDRQNREEFRIFFKRIKLQLYITPEEIN